MRVCYEALCDLHRLHLLHVPFENLDIQYGIPIELNREAFYQKIVLRRRGGFCYELNGLFFELLSRLGFNVKQVSAQPCDANGVYSPVFDHMALVVRLGHAEYLVDVGFGDFFLTPKKLVPGEPQTDATGEYILDQGDGLSWQINKLEDGQLSPQYKFQNRHVPLEQFQQRCDFHQTDPDSHFKKQKVVSLATKDGRTTLTAERLKITTAAGLRETIFPSDEFETRLMDVFGIEIQ